jgi:hypothetical protein
MNHSSCSFPSAEEGLRLHFRLCDLDPVAPADACRAYLEPLEGWLAVTQPSVDAHLRQTAIHDALVAYFERPGAYDPGRGDLAAYLRMSAQADLRNALRGEGRHHRSRVALSFVELRQGDGNLPGSEDEPLLALQRK